MYVAVVPNRNSPPAILLRESFREHGKVRSRTIANLSHWPATQIEALRQVLKGETPTAAASAFDITRSRPHGHAAAVLGTMEQLGLPAMLDESDSRLRRAVLALIASRILEPGSKLATSRALREATCHSTLGESLRLGAINEDDLYEAMDWLVERQASVENALAARHLEAGTLVLYDLTSTYFEGLAAANGKAQRGYSRDHRPDCKQVVIGLVVNRDGFPIAHEVFAGNTQSLPRRRPGTAPRWPPCSICSKPASA